MGFGPTSDAKNTFVFKPSTYEAIAKTANASTMLAVFDTGTSFSMIPKTYWDAYTKQIITSFDLKDTQI